MAEVSEGVPLTTEDVLTTPELAGRPARPRDGGAETRALLELADELASDPAGVLQRLTDVIVELCRAGSAGVSVVRGDAGEEHFHWPAVSGRWADKAGGTVPIDARPCAAAIARDTPLLLQSPEPLFPTAAQDLPVKEILLVPFQVGGRPVGALWAIAHDDRKFDAGDARLLTGLSRFAAAAWRLTTALGEVEAGRRERECNMVLRAQQESEKHYRAFVMASADTVYRMSPDWSEMRQLHGRGVLADTATVSSTWMNKYILPEDRERVRAAIDRAIRTKSIFELEHAVRRADGTCGWTMSRAVPILGEDGEIIEWLGTASDLTESKAAAERLRASEERYRVLVDSVDEGFCIIEMMFDDRRKAYDYRFLQVNPAFGRLTGLVDPVGKTLLELVPETERRWIETFGRIALTGVPARFEEEAGALGRWYDVYACRIGDPDRRQVAILFQDILPRKRTELLLRQSEERQGFLLMLSDALRPLGDPAEIQLVAAKVLGQHLGASRVAYAEHDPDGGSFAVTRSYTHRASEVAGRFRYEGFGADVLGQLEAGRLQVRPDVANDGELTDAERRALAGADIGAFIAVPLVKAGRLVAFLGVNYSRAHDFAPREIELVTEVAERTWAAVVRARAEAALRESEARLAAAFESVPAGVAFINLSGAVVISNARYRRYLPSGVMPSRDPALAGRWRGWDSEGRPLAMQDFPGARAMRGESVVPGQEMLHTDDGGQEVWTSIATAPMRDDRGRTTGTVSVISDIDAVKRAGEALRASEERLRQFGENSPDTLWIMDADNGRLEYLSDAYERMWGEPRQRVMENLALWSEHIHPDDRQRVAEGMPRLLAGERHSVEYRIIRPDGEMRWIYDTGFPIKDAHGRVTRLAGVAQDITARRVAEDRVRESELRFRSLSEGVPQLVWRSADGGGWTWASPQWTDYTGQSEADSHGQGWLDMVHPDDREAALTGWERSRFTGHLSADYRLRQVEDGRYRWFTTRATPVRDDDGQLVEWLGTSTDVDDLRSLQKHQQRLLAELQHRVRNSLAVIRSIARRTADTSENLEELSMHLDGRLGAFARTQAAVTRDPTGGLDLRTIVVDELLAHAAREGEQAHVSGPEVRLQPKAGETLALAFHELATNSVKYGALSVAEGKARVAWRVERDGTDRDWLAISWDETRPGEPIVPPTRRGFGTELLEDTLGYQLEAETLLVFRPTGLLCTISIPLTPDVGTPA